MGKSIREVLDLQQKGADTDLRAGRSLKLKVIFTDRKFIPGENEHAFAPAGETHGAVLRLFVAWICQGRNFQRPCADRAAIHPEGRSLIESQSVDEHFKSGTG